MRDVLASILDQLFEVVFLEDNENSRLESTLELTTDTTKESQNQRREEKRKK